MPAIHLNSCPVLPGVTLRLSHPYTTSMYVRLLQEDLNKLGYKLAVDGVYGPETTAAVIALQNKYLGSTTPRGKIVRTGIVGPATWCLVLSLAGGGSQAPPKPSPTPTPTPSYVPPTIPVQVLPEMVVGQRFSYQWRAVNGRTPYHWFLVSGSLPPGLTLGTSGLMAGTPTSVGSYKITIAVTDVHAHTAQRSTALRVVAPAATGILPTLEALPGKISTKLHVPVLAVDVAGAALVGGGLIYLARNAGGSSGRGSSSGRRRR